MHGNEGLTTLQIIPLAPLLMSPTIALASSTPHILSAHHAARSCGYDGTDTHLSQQAHMSRQQLRTNTGGTLCFSGSSSEDLHTIYYIYPKNVFEKHCARAKAYRITSAISGGLQLSHTRALLR